MSKERPKIASKERFDWGCCERRNRQGRSTATGKSRRWKKGELSFVKYPLLALSGHAETHAQCPLLTQSRHPS
jgi:hypothetical protein